MWAKTSSETWESASAPEHHHVPGVTKLSEWPGAPVDPQNPGPLRRKSRPHGSKLSSGEFPGGLTPIGALADDAFRGVNLCKDSNFHLTSHLADITFPP